MGKKKDQSTLFGADGADPMETRSPEDDALLEELAQQLLEARPRDVVESRFRKQYADLHFRIRSRFSSYCNALAMLLKDELGQPLDADAVLGQLQDRYGQGQPIVLEDLLTEDPRLAQALVREYGTLDAALEGLGIDPTVAAADRRWEKTRVFNEVLELLGDSVGDLSEGMLAQMVPLLSEVVQLQFGSFSTFHREFSQWVEAQAAVFLLWGRNNLSRVLARNVPVTSRGGKGPALADVQRVKLCTPAATGQKLHVLSTQGLLYPLDAGAIPFVSFGAGASEAAARLPSFGRGEKPLALVGLEDREGYLAMASTLGRVKLVRIADIKRVRAQGTLVMKLAPGDKVAAAATFGPDFGRLVVVTRNGRGVAFEQDGVKVSSRTSMGVYRLRFDGERGGEPVAIVGQGAQDDVILLGKNGALLRLGPAEIPSRKGASLGRRLWRTPVIGAVACPEATRLLLTTKRGRLLCFWDAQVPGRQAMRKGVMGIRLDSDDAPEAIGTL